MSSTSDARTPGSSSTTRTFTRRPSARRRLQTGGATRRAPRGVRRARSAPGGHRRPRRRPGRRTGPPLPRSREGDREAARDAHRLSPRPLEGQGHLPALESRSSDRRSDAVAPRERRDTLDGLGRRPVPQRQARNGRGRLVERKARGCDRRRGETSLPAARRRSPRGAAGGREAGSPRPHRPAPPEPAPPPTTDRLRTAP